MRNFDTSERMENAGIPDVFPIFHTARLGQKIRRSPLSPLCGAALNLSGLNGARKRYLPYWASAQQRHLPFLSQFILGNLSKLSIGLFVSDNSIHSFLHSKVYDIIRENVGKVVFSMELLDVVDENGMPTGAVVSREKAHAEGIRHRTSHVWLARKRNGNVEILLQKRCRTKDSWPGCYDISSAGHIPAGVDFIPSALRELREELGVEAKPEELIFCGNRNISSDSVFHGRPFRDRQYSRVFALWRDQVKFQIQKEEIDSVRWMELDACMEAVRQNTILHCIYPEELEMVKAALKG